MGLLLNGSGGGDGSSLGSGHSLGLQDGTAGLLIEEVQVVHVERMINLREA